MYLKPYLLFAAFCILIAACTPVASTTEPSTPTTAPDIAVASTAIPLPSITPRPTPTPRPTKPPIRVCSPLEGFAFNEIRGMVNKPFVTPRPNDDNGHHGIDIVWPIDTRPIEGTGVMAVLDGTVAAIIKDRDPYGNAIIIETPYEAIPIELTYIWDIEPGTSLYTAYAHLADAPLVELNQPVNCGQIMGYVGSTGWSDAPHLHFETRLGPPGQHFDSMAFYTTSATLEELEAYRTWRMSHVFVLCNPIEFFTITQSE